jgi:RNA polymerase sigma-70 factor (ECF subfamily)
MNQLQDNDIIQLVLKGQTNAYSILVERYQHFVFTIVLRYIPVREEAEEMAQDVFIKAYRSLAGFKGNSKFSTWLYTIVHTSCLSSLRKNKIVTKPIDDSFDTLSATSRASDRLEACSRKQWLTHAIHQLEELDGEIITLHYLAEQSLEEIALITGQSPGNVKVRLFRARQKLKTILIKQQVNHHADL